MKNQTEIEASVLAEFDRIFGRPTLSRGDNRTAYTLLRKAIFESYNPQNILEALRIQQIVDNQWEVMRFKRLSTRFVDGKRRRAFEKMSHRWSGYVSEEGEEFLNDCKRNRVGLPSEEALKTVGLSRDLVDAKALVLAAPQVAIIDSLIANKNAANKAAHNDYERSRRLRAKQKAKEGISALKTESDNDNGSVGRWGAKRRWGPKKGIA